MKKALLFVVVLAIIGAVSFTHKDKLPFIGKSGQMQESVATSSVSALQVNSANTAKPAVSKNQTSGVTKKYPAHHIEKITPSSAKRLETIQIYGKGFFESDGYAFFFFEAPDGKRVETAGTISTAESGLRVAKVLLKEPCTPGERVVGTNIGYIGKCSSPYLVPGEYKVYSGIDANQTNEVSFRVLE